MTGSNRRPSACKADALPAELITLKSERAFYSAKIHCQFILCFSVLFLYLLGLLLSIYEDLSQFMLS